MLEGALGVEQEGAPPDDAPGGSQRCLPLPLWGHLSLWLWGVLGPPSPSGLSACCPEPQFCQGPQGRTCRTCGLGGGRGCSAASRYLEKMPHHAPSFGTRAVCLSPHPHVCCTGFLSSSSPTFPRTEGLPGLCCPWLQSLPGARIVARGSRTWDPGPWAGPQDGHGGVRGPAAHSFPASFHPSHTQSSSRPAAVGIEHG